MKLNLIVEIPTIIENILVDFVNINSFNNYENGFTVKKNNYIFQNEKIFPFLLKKLKKIINNKKYEIFFMNNNHCKKFNDNLKH